jgi:hypothetical protein
MCVFNDDGGGPARQSLGDCVRSCPFIRQRAFNRRLLEKFILRRHCTMSHKAKFIFFKGGLDICGEFSAGQTIAEIKQFLLHEHISAFKPESQDIVLVHVESESKLTDDAQRVSTLGTSFSILVNVVKKLQRVVFFSHDGTEIFNRPFPLTATVLDLKRTIDASNHISMDLLTKNRETKEWTEQLCSDNCELSSIQHHSRPDGALHIRIRVREVWRLQAFIGLFADPFVVNWCGHV